MYKTVTSRCGPLHREQCFICLFCTSGERFSSASFCDSIFLCITLTKRTLQGSKQSEPYVKAYKFLLKSVRFIRAKIFILDLSEKPNPSTGRLSCLLILLFQHKHINIHIRTLEILYV